jgi:ribosome modulation factor
MTEALARDVGVDASVELAVALHLTVRGERAEVAETIARRWLASPSSLHLARLLFARKAGEATTQQADLGLIRAALGDAASAGASYERIVELTPEQAAERARRQGWAAAVLCRRMADCPFQGPPAVAWRAGFRDFIKTFDRFMEGR